MSKVVVIGGGISGLACARGIVDRCPGAQVTVLEAGTRTGGSIRSESEDGFLWERGPSGFLNTHPSTVALAVRVGLGDDVITGCEQVRRRYILSGGRLRRFPDSPRSFFTSDLLTWRGRARAALEPIVPSGPAGVDESVGAFARRRLGVEAAELLIDPVVSGIYAGDPERLSLAAAVPQLANLDGSGRSLIKTLLMARHRASAQTTSPSGLDRQRYVSFRGGIGQLVAAVSDSLGARIQQGAPVRSVQRAGSGWRVHVGGAAPTEILADVVVSAAPGQAAAGFLGHLHPTVDRFCREVPSAPVAMVALGYREADVPHPLAGFGYLVPRREGGVVLGVLWSTSIFPDTRAQRGKVLLQAILGGARHPELADADDERLIRETRVQLQRALGITARPILVRTHRHHPGIPQYVVGHAQRLARAEAALLELPGLFLTGNSFRGIGINACTRDADRTADAVQSYLDALERMRGRGARAVGLGEVAGARAEPN